MSGEIFVNGVRIRVDGNDISINSNKEKDNEKDVLTDTVFKKDFRGNIRIPANNVKIIIEGNFFGDIIGNCSVEIKGKHQGDIVGNVNFR